MMIATRFRLALAALLAAPFSALALSVGPLEMPAAPAAKSQQVRTLRMSADEAAPARIALPALAEARIAQVKRANGEAIAKRLQIGIARAVDSPSAAAMALDWADRGEGRVAHWEVQSAGAAALRIGFDVGRLPAGAELRLVGAGMPEAVMGPVRANELAAAGGTWWSPVLEGDSARIEVFVPAWEATEAVDLAIRQVSHLFVSPRSPRAEALAKAGSGACEVDFICRAGSDAQLAQTGRSVARMTFVEAGDTFTCTGTLLNTTTGNFIPYFYSAAHCVSTQGVANTITTHWFYESTTCGVEIINPAYVTVSGGATLLFANETSDVLFVRLNNSPPANAIFAGWDATTLTVGTPVTAVHHPVGDIKKVSLGTVFNINDSTSISPGGSFTRVNWNALATGVTEGGSSGSGIFSGNSGAGYRFRGGLLGGPSSCTAAPANLYDYYSRFDQAFNALSQYLAPLATTSANYTALWWNPNEPGWGLNLNQQGDTAFATLFTYNSSNEPQWFVMSAGQRQGSADVFTGALFRTTGTPFSTAPFSPSSVSVTQVGTMTLTFSGVNTATLNYSVNGVNVSKQIQKQVFGSRAATCQGTSSSRATASNYQDLWWNANESGWGLNVTHQDNTIFATLFIYDTDRAPVWLVMSNGVRQSDGSYLGELFVTTGPVFNAQPWGAVSLGQVGSMRLRFQDGNNATLEYTVQGTLVTKSITRQVFGASAPLCTS